MTTANYYFPFLDLGIKLIYMLINGIIYSKVPFESEYYGIKKQCIENEECL